VAENVSGNMAIDYIRSVRLENNPETTQGHLERLVAWQGWTVRFCGGTERFCGG